MSETGATGVSDEQIRAAAEQFPLWRIAHTSEKLELEYQLRRWLQYLVPPGYQIVPAGSVVLTADEANVARNACLTSATVMDTMNEADAAGTYRALAAKLGGAS